MRDVNPISLARHGGGSGGIFRSIVVALSLAASAAFAHGDLVATDGQNVARLTDHPCTFGAVVSRLEQGTQDSYHAAIVLFQGQTFQACWTQVGTSALLQYEDGDRGLLPMSMFQEQPEA